MRLILSRSIILLTLLTIPNLLITSILKAQVLPGSMRAAEYFPLLKDKKVGLVVNQTSVLGKMHLVDTLKHCGYFVAKIFAPEHGFRGDKEAGKEIKNSIDKKTKLPIVSLYGENKKPSQEDMQGIDVMVFDIQDVGCRFYTYLSTLHYLMEACAESKVPLLVLDRPNPNGYYIDGPVLDSNFKSFVGMHPVPIVYGMSIGEYAKMINGEHWLKGGIQCSLNVIPCYNYKHDTWYVPPIPPSPNLRTIESIYLYPSLCLFEGTDVSVGRGTDKPFEIIGKPGFEKGRITFKPKSIKGIADNPPYEGVECKGFPLTQFCNSFIKPSCRIYLLWLQGFYLESDTTKFFNPFFDKLAGTDKLRKDIMTKRTVDQIYQSWEPQLIEFSKVRAKYLIYPDFGD